MQKLFKNEKEDIEMAAAPILTAEQQLQELIAARQTNDETFVSQAHVFSICHAPKLLAKLKRMQEALEYYANGIGWSEQQDNGEIARKALEDSNE